MEVLKIVPFFLFVVLTCAQRGHYAGNRPIVDGLKGGSFETQLQPQQQQSNRGNAQNNKLMGNEIQPVNTNQLPSFSPFPNNLPQYNPYTLYNQLAAYQQPFWYQNSIPFYGIFNRQ
ncbi:hypothetical protein PVAND_015243 [Polypedilum vanderplanki]|uniref:Uncharacterized protein n=1 Tax=Polypedilum vanderplanki TaxID=319348 RepID=A0A9J6BCF4_POLVA|nr:hypothetical protein PVAND_015243 [Polypedilum vanderplanki]